MNELEKRKLDTFMGAFTKVNDTFHQIFSDITNGGNARMALCSPDNPFEGGLDVLLQFPGKTLLTIRAANSGAKSSAINYESSCLLQVSTMHSCSSYAIQ